MIKITQKEKILAHETTESPSSHYGSPIWKIEKDPEPGTFVTLHYEQETVDMKVITIRDGWLVCQLPDSLLIGIIWSDGNYYADLIVNNEGAYTSNLSEGCRVLNTVSFGNDLGAMP